MKTYPYIGSLKSASLQEEIKSNTMFVINIFFNYNVNLIIHLRHKHV